MSDCPVLFNTSVSSTIETRTPSLGFQDFNSWSEIVVRVCLCEKVRSKTRKRGQTLTKKMSLPDTKTRTLILHNWFRLTNTHKKHLSLKHILSIIIKYTEHFHLAFISNLKSGDLYSCTINPHDLTKPFFTNLKQIEIPLPNTDVPNLIFCDQRPNHPTQFLLYRRARSPESDPQILLYDFTTNQVITKLKPLNLYSNRCRFLDEHFVVVSLFNKLQIHHIFEEENVKDVNAHMWDISGRISNECMYSADDYDNEINLCWVWDDQKEMEIDVPVSSEKMNLGSGHICFENKIFVTVDEYPKRWIMTYDLDENVWLESKDISPHGDHGFCVCGDHLLLLDKFPNEEYEKMEVWVLRSESGEWERREFDLPVGFEEGLSVIWI